MPKDVVEELEVVPRPHSVPDERTEVVEVVDAHFVELAVLRSEGPNARATATKTRRTTQTN